MSRNNKNAREHAIARQMSARRKNGNKGPEKTEAKHGKKNAWWQKFKTYGAYIAGGKRAQPQEA